MNLDIPIHIVICRHGKARFMAERDLANASLMDTVRDIVTGQIADVERVLEINPVEGTARDVSADVARNCGHVLAELCEPFLIGRDLRDFIEEHCGLNTVIKAVA